MAKYIAYSNEAIKHFSCDIKDLTELKILKLLRIMEPKENWQEVKKLPRGSHFCEYCGDIAAGTYKDLLCADCQQTFGHSLYSEL